ncbi:hypothetical protein I3F58_10200 [Streptomyces sp. MUM 203J]|uniref:hypothetical protein n=1 Tax=Streptomyces sp. MUM 203J TaxID=2791990 RepID=UPI001F035A84|nr:hypothetical protein [Streptomyces sp. MUM 203J]MCH0539927.1 hypothetical protein [Streptomyces sp. MUM 203J]
MAKNKKQDRSQKGASQAEREAQQAKSASMEERAKSAVEATPGDVARKHRERRFGHN